MNNNDNSNNIIEFKSNMRQEQSTTQFSDVVESCESRIIMSVIKALRFIEDSGRNIIDRDAHIQYNIYRLYDVLKRNELNILTPFRIKTPNGTKLKFMKFRGFSNSWVVEMYKEIHPNHDENIIERVMPYVYTSLLKFGNGIEDTHLIDFGSFLSPDEISLISNESHGGLFQVINAMTRSLNNPDYTMEIFMIIRSVWIILHHTLDVYICTTMQDEEYVTKDTLETHRLHVANAIQALANDIFSLYSFDYIQSGLSVIFTITVEPYRSETDDCDRYVYELYIKDVEFKCDDNEELEYE